MTARPGGRASGRTPTGAGAEALTPAARRVVRGCAALDLAVTGCLAVPPAARALLGALAALDRGLGGTGPAPELPALAWLFVHVTGALGVLWALARLLRPSRFLGLADAIGRCWVGGLVARAVLLGAAPAVFAVFVATEWLGGAAQLAVLWRRGRGGVA